MADVKVVYFGNVRFIGELVLADNDEGMDTLKKACIFTDIKVPMPIKDSDETGIGSMQHLEEVPDVTLGINYAFHDMKMEGDLYNKYCELTSPIIKATAMPTNVRPMHRN